MCDLCHLVSQNVRPLPPRLAECATSATSSRRMCDLCHLVSQKPWIYTYSGLPCFASDCETEKMRLPCADVSADHPQAPGASERGERRPISATLGIPEGGGHGQAGEAHCGEVGGHGRLSAAAYFTCPVLCRVHSERAAARARHPTCLVIPLQARPFSASFHIYGKIRPDLYLM
jgi:hypothetical protein